MAVERFANKASTLASGIDLWRALGFSERTRATSGKGKETWLQPFTSRRV